MLDEIEGYAACLSGMLAVDRSLLAARGLFYLIRQLSPSSLDQVPLSLEEKR